MKIVAYLNEINEAPVSDVILATKELSRTGDLNLSELNYFCDKCQQNKVRPILEWDILMTENNFQKSIESLKKIDLTKFYAIRVQDPGAINYILENHPEILIQLLLETGNHNFKSIETWISLLGNSLERVILSIELPKETLKDYLRNLNILGVDSEILGLGKVLLFYTPRSLLSPLVEQKAEKIEVLATGEETPHKNFPVVENKHGTFMYNTKNHFLLDHLKELKEMGLTYLRLDLRFEGAQKVLTLIEKLLKTHDQNVLDEIKGLYPAKIGKGFYRANRTDVLFKKLKNENLSKGQGQYLGDVIDVRKKRLMGIQFKSPDMELFPGDFIEIRTPEGKVKSVQVREMLDSSLNSIDSCSLGKIFFMSHVGGVSVRSRIFKEDKI